MWHGILSCGLPALSAAIALVIKLYILTVAQSSFFYRALSLLQHPYFFCNSSPEAKVYYEHSSPLHPALRGSQVKEEKRETAPFHPRWCLISGKLQSNFSDMAVQAFVHSLLLTPTFSLFTLQMRQSSAANGGHHASDPFKHGTQTFGLAPSPSISLLPDVPYIKLSFCNMNPKQKSVQNLERHS